MTWKTRVLVPSTWERFWQSLAAAGTPGHNRCPVSRSGLGWVLWGTWKYPVLCQVFRSNERRQLTVLYSNVWERQWIYKVTERGPVWAGGRWDGTGPWSGGGKEQEHRSDSHAGLEPPRVSWSRAENQPAFLPCTPSLKSLNLWILRRHLVCWLEVGIVMNIFLIACKNL